MNEGKHEDASVTSEAFDDDNFKRVTIGYLSSTVVLQTPADGCGEDESRTVKEAECTGNVVLFDEEQNAGDGHECDGTPQSLADSSREEDESDNGYGYNLEVVEKCCVCRRA